MRGGRDLDDILAGGKRLVAGDEVEGNIDSHTFLGLRYSRRCHCGQRHHAAITKALVFMGTSSFVFAGGVQADSSFAWFAEFLSASSCCALCCIPPEQHNALAVNRKPSVGELVRRGE